jgi:hypothetical protein
MGAFVEGIIAVLGMAAALVLVFMTLRNGEEASNLKASNYSEAHTRTLHPDGDRAAA